MRQCQVFNASPDEPEEFFPTLQNGARTTAHSQTFKLILMGEYFWSLERLRVVSAWERGDFCEAQLWLKVHQIHHKILYKLAGILVRYTNWEIDNFVKLIGDWLGSNDVAKAVKSEQIQAWCKSRSFNQDNKWSKLLHRIRIKRNQVIHESEAVTLSQIRSLWNDGNLFSVKISEDSAVVNDLMLELLKQLSTSPNLDKLLVRSLYKWGLQVLQESI